MKLKIRRTAGTFLIPIICFALISCGSTKSSDSTESSESTEHESKNSHVVKVTDATFEQEVLKSDTPVLVDFWAPWCGPCKMMGPIVDEISNDLSGKVKVMKLNTDENPKTAAASNITGIPTLKLYKSGKVVEEVVGAVEKSYLTEKINKHL